MLLTVYPSGGLGSLGEVDPVTPTIAGDTFPNDGRTMLKVINGANATVVTVHSQPCSHGRLKNAVYNTLADKEYLLGPFDPSLFNDQSTGLVTVTYDQNTETTVAAVRSTT